MFDGIVIGIDPGKSGGIAIVYNQHHATATPMIIGGSEIDISKTVEWLQDNIKDRFAIAYIEKVHAMPGQGVSSMFSFGFNCGIMHGVISTLEIPLYIVAPVTWQKAVLNFTTKDKNAAIDYCRRTYPNVSLLATPRSKKMHSGMADALCIARYAYDKHHDIR